MLQTSDILEAQILVSGMHSQALCDMYTLHILHMLELVTIAFNPWLENSGNAWYVNLRHLYGQINSTATYTCLNKY